MLTIQGLEHIGNLQGRSLKVCIHCRGRYRISQSGVHHPLIHNYIARLSYAKKNIDGSINSHQNLT